MKGISLLACAARLMWMLVVFVSVPHHAWAFDLSTVRALIESSEMEDLDLKMEEVGYHLSSVVDTGERFRCPCYRYYVVFYKHDASGMNKRVFLLESNFGSIRISEEDLANVSLLESLHGITIRNGAEPAD